VGVVWRNWPCKCDCIEWFVSEASERERERASELYSI
jgi:hypothetical protein